MKLLVVLAGFFVQGRSACLFWLSGRYLLRVIWQFSSELPCSFRHSVAKWRPSRNFASAMWPDDIGPQQEVYFDGN
jgi:hypothetical protein